MGKINNTGIYKLVILVESLHYEKKSLGFTFAFSFGVFQMLDLSRAERLAKFPRKCHDRATCN